MVVSSSNTEGCIHPLLTHLLMASRHLQTFREQEVQPRWQNRSLTSHNTLESEAGNKIPVNRVMGCVKW